MHFCMLSVNDCIDQSDNDLRDAIANLIAVVFGLPDCTTHIWYHMFSPVTLDGTFMTGFMVCISLLTVC